MWRWEQKAISFGVFFELMTQKFFLVFFITTANLTVFVFLMQLCIPFILLPLQDV